MSESDWMGRKSYAGFFTVNETYNSNMYFWFFPSIVSSNVHYVYVCKSITYNRMTTLLLLFSCGCKEVLVDLHCLGCLMRMAPMW